MLVIRRAQFCALAEARRRAFVEHAIHRLASLFPHLNQRSPRPAVVDALTQGLHRAGGYGLVTENEVLRFLSLMWIFGKDFDGDATCAWATEALSVKAESDPTARIDRAFGMGLDRLAEGRGLGLDEEAPPAPEPSPPPAEIVDAAEAAEDFDTTDDEDDEDDDAVRDGEE